MVTISSGVLREESVNDSFPASTARYAAGNSVIESPADMSIEIGM